jgi:MerR family mercuric resistance operon transcriptional regulator
MEHLTIGRLAALAEVNVETVRYYQRRGLLPEPSRKRGEIRRYGSDEVEQLRFIRRAQEIGFSLREIGHLLHLKAHGECQETRGIVAERLSAVEQQIALLSTHRAELKAWIAICDQSTPDSACPRLTRLRSERRQCDSC